MSKPKLSEESERLLWELDDARDDMRIADPAYSIEMSNANKRCEDALASIRAHMAYLESRVAELEARQVEMQNIIYELRWSE